MTEKTICEKCGNWVDLNGNHCCDDMRRLQVGDLIRRGDAFAACRPMNGSNALDKAAAAIAALPAVTVGVPEATVYRAVLDWIRDDAGLAVKMSMTPDRANALTARILAALGVTPAPYTRTGVMDKDGREICVGDRIMIDINSGATKREYWCPEYEVVFDPPCFTLKHVGGDKDSDTARFYWRVPQPRSTEKITTISVAAPQRRMQG